MKEKIVLCAYCQSQETTSFLKTEKFEYFKCKNCDLIFLFPQPNNNHLQLLNRKMYGKKENILAYLKREKYYRQVFRKILRQIRKYKKRGKILDVGCFYGLFLDEARKIGFKPLGIEVEKEPTQYASCYLNLPVLNKPFLEVDICQKFDIVTFNDVLEHLKELKLVLGKIKKLLKKNGILFIRSPNIDSFVFKLTKEKWNWLLPGVHLYHFSLDFLKKFLKENGFKILSITTDDDMSEFAYNLIDILGIKKRNLMEKVIWKVLRVIFLIILQFSFVWNYFQKGGIINLLAKKVDNRKIV